MIKICNFCAKRHFCNNYEEYVNKELGCADWTSEEHKVILDKFNAELVTSTGKYYIWVDGEEKQEISRQAFELYKKLFDLIDDFRQRKGMKKEEVIQVMKKLLEGTENDK